MRRVLPVELIDGDGLLHWGLWAEVGLADYDLILRAWNDPRQGEVVPFPVRLANRVAGLRRHDRPGGLAPARLVAPHERPRLAFAPDARHPFALECRTGVTVHRALEWLAAITLA